jgi:hypothetical protein
MKKKQISATLIFLLLSGCGKLGYKSEYTADIKPQVSEKVALEYYKTVSTASNTATENARLALEASRDIAASIGQPLAPPEAVQARQELSVTGNSKTFDIAKSVPPEPLLPLAQERTKQVLALTAVMRRAVLAARPGVAAPAGFVPPSPDQTDFFDIAVLDNLPTAPSPVPADDGAIAVKKSDNLADAGEYADVLDAARQAMTDNDEKNDE